MSLKNRLIAVATAWIGFGIVLAWLILSNVFQSHVTKQFYEELFVHLEELQRLARIDGGQAILRAPLSDPRYDVENSGFYWEIQQADQVLARSASLKAAPLRTPDDHRSDIGVHTHVIAGPTGTLLIAEKLDWPEPGKAPIQFLIGTDQRHLDAVVGRFNHTLSWALTLFGLSMVLAAALLIVYAMRPLAQVYAALHLVQTGKAKTLTGTHPAEVQPLIDSLNALLNSTHELIQRARTQAGNLAHGLKTPLAILTDEAHRLQEQGQSASSATILEQCGRMQTHIDYQTTRARVVANRLAPGSVADVGMTAADVIAAMSRLYQSRGISFEAAIPEGALVACDAQDLQELLGNLLDNAGKHARSLVTIGARCQPNGYVEISVADDGPGLPPEAHEVVFEVGQRWDTQKAGSGLGLAIARDLVTLYGGSIVLGSSPSGGLLVTVTLPNASPAAAR
ncbi:MAG: HAMP domain-containing histidine kinase [Hyphomonas sp.]|nr:HAMP domain-containing histidine kinase [Hyphomonas sp.]